MKLSIISIAAVLAAFPAYSFAASGTAIPGGNQSDSFVINKPGAYYLAADRVMTVGSVNGIEIRCDNVTIDLNGFTESYTILSGRGSGIAGLAVRNVEIKNGFLVNIPGMGIKISGLKENRGGTVRIVDIKCASLGAVGIDISSCENIAISRCTVDHSNLGIGAGSGTSASIFDCVVSKCFYGIVSNIRSCQIGRCVVSDCESNGIEQGNPSGGSSVADCVVTSCNQSSARESGGISIVNGAVSNNTVASCGANGIVMVYGRACNNTILNTFANTDHSGHGAAINSLAGGTYSNNHYTAGTLIVAEPGLIDGGGNIAF